MPRTVSHNLPPVGTVIAFLPPGGARPFVGTVARVHSATVAVKRPNGPPRLSRLTTGTPFMVLRRP